MSQSYCDIQCNDRSEQGGRPAPEEVVAENRETLELVADGNDDAAVYAERILAAYGGEDGA